MLLVVNGRLFRAVWFSDNQLAGQGMYWLVAFVHTRTLVWLINDQIRGTDRKAL